MKKLLLLILTIPSLVFCFEKTEDFTKQSTHTFYCQPEVLTLFLPPKNIIPCCLMMGLGYRYHNNTQGFDISLHSIPFESLSEFKDIDTILIKASYLNYPFKDENSYIGIGTAVNALIPFKSFSKSDLFIPIPILTLGQGFEVYKTKPFLQIDYIFPAFFILSGGIGF